MNLVTIICHDLGQHLGCYGQRVRTPNLDAFAAENLRFARSFCSAPQCSPSRAALWSGRFPHANGVVGLAHAGFANDYHPGERHLAQMLGDAGYETALAGIQHASPSAARCGFQRLLGGGGDGAITDKAVAYLQEKGAGKEARPFHLQIGYFQPHRPFPHPGAEVEAHDQVRVPAWLPDIPAIREDIADIEASIRSVDAFCGRVFAAIDAAGLAEDTIVLFTTDHGIAFPHAKMSLYDRGLETALMMRVPGIAGRRVLRPMISNVDVLPTLLDLLGQALPDNLHGRSFKGLLTGEEYAPNAAIFGEKTYHSYYDPMRCIRTERYKLIANFEHVGYQEIGMDFENNFKSYPETHMANYIPNRGYHPPYELYDLTADPLEFRNLADDPAWQGTRDGLIRRLRDWMVATGDPLLDGPMAQAAYTKRMAAFKAL